MKSLFCIVVVISVMFALAQGCSIMECATNKADCKSLLSSLDCLKECNLDIPDAVYKALKDAGCGASSLTHIGLPMMILVALAAFYNK